MADLEFVIKEDWEKFMKESPWATFVPSVANQNRQIFMRNALIQNSPIYKAVNNDATGSKGWKCNDCGSDIMSATVAHPIHDGPFPLSGSGQCHYEDVPYCPKCEEKPNYNGSSITIPFRG